jgi:hypothetical protein
VRVVGLRRPRGPGRCQGRRPRPAGRAALTSEAEGG